MSESGMQLNWNEQVLGLVPEEWNVGPLDRILTSIDAGRSPDLPDQPAQAGEWGVLKVSAIRPQGLQETENKVVIQPSLIDPSIEVKHGDLLVSRANTPTLVGLACYVSRPRSGLMLSDKTLRLNIDSTLALPKFISYLLQAPFSRRQIETSGTGSSGSMKNISQDEIRSLILPLPGIQEQYRLAESLDTADEAIQSAERLITKLEQDKQGLSHDLLTRGIDESGELRDPARPGTFVNSDLGLIPCDWRVISVADTASESRGSLVIGPFGSDLVANSYRSSGVPVVFVRDVQPDNFSWISNVYVSTQKAAELSAHTVHAGDLVITKMGLPPAIAAVYPDGLPPGVVTADIIRLRPDADAVDPAWLSLAINSDSTLHQIAAITGGVTRPKITLRDFRRTLIALPPRGEQKAISDLVRALTAELVAVRRERDKLLLLKRGLMGDLLTGRVRVGVPS